MGNRTDPKCRQEICSLLSKIRRKKSKIHEQRQDPGWRGGHLCRAVRKAALWGEELRSENLSQNSVHMNTQAEEFREHLFGICYSKLPLSRRQCSEMETQVNRANTSQNATPVCIYYVTRSIGQAFGGGRYLLTYK